MPSPSRGKRSKAGDPGAPKRPDSGAAPGPLEEAHAQLLALYPEAVATMLELAASDTPAVRAKVRSYLRNTAARVRSKKGDSWRKIKEVLDRALAELGAD